MFTFDVTPYGFKFHSQGYFSIEASQTWLDGYKKIIAQVSKKGKPFGQFADLRDFKPGPPEAQQAITDGMKVFKAAGGQRSIVLLDNPIAAMQIKRLAKESGIYEWERYIDIITHPNFEPIVDAWLTKGTDPDAIKK